ncbi:MAG: hypothetical protein Ta2E_11150 [Mycoplasmoidaceae bacterium]|nr:MAG: hypothetical protein Ta2E_11150 [Mycoplasmoidaceae bacterium]
MEDQLKDKNNPFNAKRRKKINKDRMMIKRIERHFETLEERWKKFQVKYDPIIVWYLGEGKRWSL